MPKTILQEHQSCSLQKRPRKNTKYSRHETILKIVYLAKAIAHAKARGFPKRSVWVKDKKCRKHAKNHSATALELFSGENGIEKKNPKYSKNETVLKIDHLAKAITHAKAL